jgi:tetratricopeptide (TPR) repeat protein
MTDSSSSNNSTGKLVVILLLALGVVAGSVAVVYWKFFVKVAPTNPSDLPLDRKAAEADLLSLTELYRQAKENRRMEPMLDQAEALVKRHPKYAPARVLLAQVLIELLDWQRAYDELQVSLKLDDQQPQAHRVAGTLQYIMKDYEKAEQHFEIARQLQPDDPIYLVYLAQVDIRMQRYEQSMARLLKALEMKSDLHEAYATMSDVVFAQNKNTLALQYIDKAIDTARVGSLTNRSLMLPYFLKRSEVLLRTDPPGALKYLLEEPSLLDHERYYAESCELIARAYGSVNPPQPKLAAEHYERAMGRDPSDWRLAAGAARWQLKVGQIEAAKLSLSVLKQLKPRPAHLQMHADAVRALEAELAKRG